ncbi:TPA: hypothetical protein NIF38_007186 [Pseudomonas aeruginosa]|nr:hypothetical protein [Pseudomonas aeruginosa]
MVQGATGEEGGQGPPRSGGDAEEQNGALGGADFSGGDGIILEIDPAPHPTSLKSSRFAPVGQGRALPAAPTAAAWIQQRLSQRGIAMNAHNNVKFSMTPFVIGKRSVQPQVVARDGKFFPAISESVDGYAPDSLAISQPCDSPQEALAAAITLSVRQLDPLMVNRNRLEELVPGDRLLTAVASVPDAELPFQSHHEMVVFKAAEGDQGPVLVFPDDVEGNLPHPVSFDGFIAEPAAEFYKVFAVLPQNENLTSSTENLVYQSCVTDPIPAGAVFVFTNKAGESAVYQIDHVGPNGYIAVPYSAETPSEENAIELDFSGVALDGSGRATRLATLIPDPANAANVLKHLHSSTEFSARALSAGEQAARIVFSDHPGDLQNLVPSTLAMLAGEACKIVTTTNPDIVCVQKGKKDLFFDRKGNGLTEPDRKIDAIGFVVSGSVTPAGAEHAFANADSHQLMVSRPMIDTSLEALRDAKRGDHLVLSTGPQGKKWDARVIRQESVYHPDKMLVLIESPDPVERRIVGIDPLTGMVDCEGLNFLARVEHTPAGSTPAELLRDHLLHNEAARDEMDWRLDLTREMRPHVTPGAAHVDFTNREKTGTGRIKLNLRDQTVSIDHADGAGHKVFELYSRDAHIALQGCGTSVYADLLDRKVFDVLDARHKAARADENQHHTSTMRLG